MGLIDVKGLKVYAYHGVHEVEQLVGQWYVVDVRLNVDFSLAESHDELSGTVDYAVVADLVRIEMAVKSKLIEHVSGRIKAKIKNLFPSIKSGEITISKLHPPVNGPITAVSVSTNF